MRKPKKSEKPKGKVEELGEMENPKGDDEVDALGQVSTSESDGAGSEESDDERKDETSTSNVGVDEEVKIVEPEILDNGQLDGKMGIFVSIIELGEKKIVKNRYQLIKKDGKSKKSAGKKAKKEKKELIPVVGSEYCLTCCGGGKTEKSLSRYY